MATRPRRSIAFATSLCLTLAMSLIAPAQIALAAPTLDQEQPTIDTSAGFSFIIGGLTQQTLAQTVTAGATGDLVQVDLPVACPSTEDLVVDIRDVAAGGEPGPTSLSTTTVPWAALPPFPAGGVTFGAITLASPVAVSPGTQFAIVLSSAATTTNCSLFPGPVGDSYAAGAFYVDSVDHNGWLCICDVANARQDLPFKTWVEAPAPPSGADLSIAKTLHNPSSLNVFSATDQFYRFELSNGGPQAATGVTLVDTLPAGITVTQLPPYCTYSAGTMTCSGATLDLSAGQSLTFFVGIQFDKAGTYTNMASASATQSDPNTANNISSHTQQVLPTADLFIVEILAPGTVDPGATITYESTVRNDGPDPAGKVVLIQAIPAGSTYVSATSPDTTICGPGTNSGEYGCQFASIPVGATRSMKVTVTMPTSPQMMTTTVTASHIIPPLILDPAQFSSLTYEQWVVAEQAQQSLTSGGSTTTDGEGDGATTDDVVETTVKTSTGGTVTILENAQNGPTGATQWTFLGIEVVITAPAGSTSDPLWLTFRIDSSFVDNLGGGQIDVWRNYGNTPIPNCQQPVYPTTPSTSTPISPDPCVWLRQILPDGDAEIIVFSSQASVWAFAIHDPLRLEDLELAGTRKAGSTLPVKFRVLDESGEVVTPADVAEIFSDGSPSSRSVSCETGEPIGATQALTIIGNGLHFDADTATWSFKWKSEKSWAGTCRELVLELIDGSQHVAPLVLR